MPEVVVQEMTQLLLNKTTPPFQLLPTGPLKRLFHYAIFQKFFHIF